MNLDYYFLYFIGMSFIGYLYETIAMTMWGGKWENRGFLFGPIIPIYGVGSLLGLLIFNSGLINNYTPLQVFLAGFIGSAVLEYPTSYIMEKLFHAKWWDYSNAPLNINGRVSLFSSIGFGVGALLIVYILNPYMTNILDNMNPVLFDISSFVLLVLFTADITFTISVISDFENRIQDTYDNLNEHLDNVTENINPKGKKLKNVFTAGVDKTDKMVSSMGKLYHAVIYRVKDFSDLDSKNIKNLKQEVKAKIDNIKGKNER